MIKLAIVVNPVGHKFLGNIVSFFSKGRAIHVEPVFSDGTAFIADPTFVGLKNRFKSYDKYHWVLIDCPWITKEEETKLRSWAETLCKVPRSYDFLGAVSGVLGSKREDPEKWYCGEICIKIFGGDIPELNELSWGTPDKIWQYVAKKADEY